MFLNLEQLCGRLLGAVRTAAESAERVVVDASPISIVDLAALDRRWQSRLELAREGVTLGFAGVRHQVWARSNQRWLEAARHAVSAPMFATPNTALVAVRDHQAPAGGAPGPGAA